MDAKNIAIALSRQISQLTNYLLPNGKQKGNEWVAGSLKGEPGESLKICLSGPKSGLWSDFATGEAGDALDLWKGVRCLDLKSALSEAADWLGVSSKPMFYQKAPRRLHKPIPKTWTATVEEPAVHAYLTSTRGLSPEIISSFDIGANGDQVIFPYYLSGNVIRAKYLGIHREEGKKRIYVTPSTPACLFGWQIINDDHVEITITEGEIDAMSLTQLGYPALSVPFGGGGKGKQNWIDHEYDNLNRFKRINICFDQDKSGQEAINEIVERLGRHRCHIVNLPCKDANEYLTTYNHRNSMSISHYFDNADECAPAAFYNAKKYADSVEEMFFPTGSSFKGYMTPWESLNKDFFFRQNELTIWGGINGHGKSRLLGQISIDLISQGARVCIASLELPPKSLLKGMIVQTTGQQNITKEDFSKAMNCLSNDLWIFENEGAFSLAGLLDIMDYAKRRFGIDVFVIDSLMKCGLSEDDYNGQKSFIEALCNFKNKYDCHIHLIVHPRKMKDENTSPGKMDIKGSGAISDLADNCFFIWRNKKENKEYDAQLTCHKQRNGEWEGDFYLWFDKQSYLFSEKIHSPTKLYLPILERKGG